MSFCIVTLKRYITDSCHVCIRHFNKENKYDETLKPLYSLPKNLSGYCLVSLILFHPHDETDIPFVS